MSQSLGFVIIATLQAPPGHVRPAEWFFLIIPCLGLLAIVANLARTGHPGEHRGLVGLLARIGSSLRHATGIPAWSVAGVAISEWSLLVAGIGFYWDVAWHVDFGRDRVLLTPPHLMILVGLMGLVGAALISIMFATLERADTGWRLKGLRVPYASVPLGALGLFALLGFPLDDLWHRTYGIDVTMWSPTHLMMIGGACLTPFATRLLVAEAGPEAGQTRWGRIIRRGLVAVMLTALTAFLLEYDLGIPQWQALYQPVLIALVTSLAMVAARITLGRGGAIAIAVNFLVVRGVFALLVGPGLGHVVPRFPIYLGIAVAVELAWYLGRRRSPLPRAILAGLLVGTLGLATEWAFSQIWGRHPWQPSLFPGIWAASAIAVPGAVLGLALGSIMSYRRPPVHWAALAGCGIAIVGLMAVPLPRHPTPMSALVQTGAVGEPRAGVDRDGRPSVEQDYAVDLSLNPAAGAAAADWFELVSWQGGIARNTRLISDGAGRYHAAAPVPTGGTWKTIIWMVRRDQLVAAPLAMPADSLYDQPAIKPEPEKTVRFQPASQVLMAESHAGAPWVGVLGYSGFFGMLLVAAVLLTVTYRAVGVRFATDWAQASTARRASPKRPSWRSSRAPQPGTRA